MNAPPATDPDAVPVTRFLRERSDAAFDALYARHARRVYGLVGRLLGPLADHADDAFQETWMRAVERLPGFRWRSSFSTWLCGIAVNCCREIRRRHGAEREPVDPDAAPDRDPGVLAVPYAAVHLERADSLDLERAVHGLPSGYREVLVLHDIHGFTHDEIAAELGIAPGTSKSQLSRARNSLRRALLDGLALRRVEHPAEREVVE